MEVTLREELRSLSLENELINNVVNDIVAYLKSFASKSGAFTTEINLDEFLVNQYQELEIKLTIGQIYTIKKILEGNELTVTVSTNFKDTGEPSKTFSINWD